VTLADGTTIEGSRFVFGIGHSSRDTFHMLHRHGVPFEAKPFSIGVRIEHPQKLIDKSLYGKWAGDARLGSAPYKFVAHCGTGRAAYSFCMCPGGLVVAATSEPGMVVTNGMSSYARAESNANSGFMVDVRPEDMPAGDVLSGIEFQRKIMTGLFGCEGFIMQRLDGDGWVFVQMGGTVIERTLAPGEVLHVDTGCVAAFTPSVNFDLESVGGVKSMLFGGEGVFFARLTGPGKVWIQSLPFSRLAGRMLQAAGGRGQNRGEGSLLGEFGDMIGGNR
jgi:hypothetical protein